MQRYIVRRLLLAVPVLIGVSLTIFIIMRVIPGDIALAILGGEGSAGVSQEKLTAFREQLGLNKPIYQQYLSWMWDFVRLDPGKSLQSGRPVIAHIRDTFPVTLELVILSIVVSLLIALPIGVLSAMRQDTWVDYVFRVVSIGGLAMPVFWTGTLIIMVLVGTFGWLPPLGYAGFFEDPLVNLQQNIWPSLAMGYYLSAAVSRMTRSQMLEVLRQDYIRTAWSKGLRERVIMYRHALKNAILPVVTLTGIQFGVLIGGAVLVEIVFVLPGMGTELIQAILRRDYPIVQTIVLLIAAVYVLVNLGVDLLYAWLDPRIRYT
ncbi:MAG: ABC transporter permease [Chloroflexota bacterium]